MQTLISVFEKRRRILNVAIFPREIGFAPTFDILNILSPQSCQITFALINIRYFAAIFFVTRPKPPYGRQGLAGLWGKDAVWRVKCGYSLGWDRLVLLSFFGTDIFWEIIYFQKHSSSRPPVLNSPN